MTRSPRPATARGEEGFSSVVAFCLCVPLFLAVVLTISIVPTWYERTQDATDAARAAARALVTAPNWAAGVAAADRAVQQEAANNGLPAGDMTASYSGTLTLGGQISATVTVTIPATTLPLGQHTPTIHWSATATQQVADFRSLP